MSLFLSTLEDLNFEVLQQSGQELRAVKDTGSHRTALQVSANQVSDNVLEMFTVFENLLGFQFEIKLVGRQSLALESTKLTLGHYGTFAASSNEPIRFNRFMREAPIPALLQHSMLSASLLLTPWSSGLLALRLRVRRRGTARRLTPFVPLYLRTLETLVAWQHESYPDEAGYLLRLLSMIPTQTTVTSDGFTYQAQVRRAQVLTQLARMPKGSQEAFFPAKTILDAENLVLSPLAARVLMSIRKGDVVWDKLIEVIGTKHLRDALLYELVSHARDEERRATARWLRDMLSGSVGEPDEAIRERVYAICRLLYDRASDPVAAYRAAHALRAADHEFDPDDLIDLGRRLQQADEKVFAGEMAAWANDLRARARLPQVAEPETQMRDRLPEPVSSGDSAPENLPKKPDDD